MTRRSRAALVSTVALAVVLLAAAVQVQAARERLYPAGDPTEDALYLQSGTALRRLTGAYNAVFADIYWIRAIQYYGSTKQRLDLARANQPIVPEPPPALAADAFPVLYPLLDITTTLDPRFNIAYRFGSVFLAEPYPLRRGEVNMTIPLVISNHADLADHVRYLGVPFVHTPITKETKAEVRRRSWGCCRGTSTSSSSPTTCRCFRRSSSSGSASRSSTSTTRSCPPS